MTAAASGTGAGGHALQAVVDLAAVAHNVRELKRILHPGTRLLAAVKANAYGHGAEQVARTVLQHGASDLGVARIDEGIALRRAGIAAPVLIFGFTPAVFTQQLIDHDLIPSVYSLEDARALGAAAIRAGRDLPVHVKVDTGMGRLGLLCDDLRPQGADRAVDDIIAIAHLKGIVLQGVFTHFATADLADKSFALRQFKRFRQLLDQLETAGIEIALRHAANSGAIMEMPETHLDMVRAGISVYGYYPSADVDRRRIALKPALNLKAPIIHLKKVPLGTPISYGCTYRTAGPTVIATVPAGYADGYNRALSNRGVMLVGGKRAPIVGRVCMDLTMIDVGHIPGVQIGDEVVLIGRQGDESLTADEIAAVLGTISYEVVAALTHRVTRSYSP